MGMFKKDIEKADMGQSELTDNDLQEECEAVPLTLEDFLAEDDIENKTGKITLCDRLKSYEFEIKIIDKEKIAKFVRASIVRDKKGRILREDAGKFNELVIIEGTAYPDFTNIDFITKCKAKTPAETLNKVLLAGEIEKLAELILAFNGFGEESFEELRDAAKN